MARFNLLSEFELFKLTDFRREKLISSGWKEVDKIDGAGIASWQGLKEKYCELLGESSFSESGMPTRPLIIENDQSLIRVNPQLRSSLTDIKSPSEFSTFSNQLKPYKKTYKKTSAL